MSYEYGTGQQGLNYPNPYKIQNKFLIFKLFLFSLSSLILFGFAKHHLNLEQYNNLTIELILAFAFVGYSVSIGFRLAKQFRVYFGRGQPAGLAAEVPSGSFGNTVSSNQLKETIRQGALILEAPSNPLSGFLYSYFKDLIIAPTEIRFLAEHVSSNLVKIFIILVCFSLSAFFSYDSKVFGWLGLFFILSTCGLILKPLFKNNISNVNLSLKSFWKLLSMSVCVPIGLIIYNKFYPNYFPDLNGYYFGFQSLIIILMAALADFLNIIALKNQLEKPTSITTTFEQEAISFNAHPAQISSEIERKLQTEWVAAIPNRVYSKILPIIGNDKTGNFAGLVMEETQPMVPENLTKELSISDIKNHLKLSKVLNIELFSLLLDLISVTFILGFIFGINTNSIKLITWFPILFGFLSISSYLVQIAHQLWGRFDFESKLYIFEWSGNFTKAKMNFGNHLKDTIQSEKDIINIESMTLRVWITHINSVVFGHGINSSSNPRKIISMIGLKDESRFFLNHLKDFAESQSMMLKPTSKEDYIRASSLSQLNSISSVISKQQQDAISKGFSTNDLNNINAGFIDDEQSKSN